MISVLPEIFFLLIGGLLLCLCVWAVHSRQPSFSKRIVNTEGFKQHPPDPLWQREIDRLNQMRSVFNQQLLRPRSDEEAINEFERQRFTAQLLWLTLYITIGRRLTGNRIPGTLLDSWADSFCSPKTMERVVRPTISDIQEEHSSALAEYRRAKVVWIRIRGHWSFWKALGLHTLKKNLATIRRLAGIR